MGVIKNLLAKWTLLLWTLLKPLGVWGVFAIAAIDSAALGMPLDPIVAGYVYLQPQKFWLYVLMASAGSALGSLIIYAIGYEMGELVLEKKMGKEKFQRVRARFEKHEFLALFVPSLMPPPFPFKLFALSAAVFEMHITHFLLAIFVGRVVRFLILSALVVLFGPQVVELIGPLFRQHAGLMGAIMAVTVGLVVLLVLRNKRKNKLAVVKR
ncbi:MAG TPA: VTT domain-containing protein [Terriglobales bacterium]